MLCDYTIATTSHCRLRHCQCSPWRFLLRFRESAYFAGAVPACRLPLSGGTGQCGWMGMTATRIGLKCYMTYLRPTPVAIGGRSSGLADLIATWHRARTKAAWTGAACAA